MKLQSSVVMETANAGGSDDYVNEPRAMLAQLQVSIIDINFLHTHTHTHTTHTQHTRAHTSARAHILLCSDDSHVVFGRLVEWKNPARALQLYSEAQRLLPDNPEVLSKRCFTFHTRSARVGGEARWVRERVRSVRRSLQRCV